MTNTNNGIARTRRRRRDERGVILIWAAITIMFIAGIVMSGTERIRALDRVTGADWTADGQAAEVARAGLTDAYAWLRRQTAQPVQSFQPKRIGAARPGYLKAPAGGWNTSIEMTGTALNETDDPDQGLVRAFEISPGIWAKYHISAGGGGETFTDINGNGTWQPFEPFVDINLDGKWNGAKGTRDLTDERGMNGNGAVWMVECTSEIFRRPRADLALGEGPNHRLARATLAQEVRRLVISPPASAAICCGDGSDINIRNRARIRGNGGNSIAYAATTGIPILGGSELHGAVSAIPSYAGFVEQVFGVPLAGLKSMADISTDDPINGVPAKIPDYALVVVDGDITFTAARPLRGTGVLIVKGDCTIEAGSNSFFNGMVYVWGNFEMRAPSYLRGTVIVTGEADIQGTGGDYCEIDYDGGIVSHLLTKMGQYRIAKSPYVPASRMEDGRPNENNGNGNGN